MNELIKVNCTDGEKITVSGRELHAALGVKTLYKDWFPRMCEYGFTEGVDFNPYKNVRVEIEGNREVTREIIDHAMTIDMAKEVCMIQRVQKSKSNVHMPYNRMKFACTAFYMLHSINYPLKLKSL